MSPTVTIDTDSEPGSWSRHSMLANLSRKTVTFQGQTVASFLGATPTCATCGGRICGCSDAQWVGASQSVHNGEVL